MKDPKQLPDWQALATLLFRALNSRPCNCTEPAWWDKEKRKAKQCSRCVALQAYSNATGVKAT